MKISWSLPVGITGLVLVLWMGASWGAPPLTPRDIFVDNIMSNTAGGINTLVNNDAGTSNTAFGQGALLDNTDGFANTAVGASALQSNDNGNENTAVGVFALVNNETGDENTALGNEALRDNREGNDNTGVGAFALLQNENGSSNTAVGAFALSGTETGFNNIAIGRGAGQTLQSGSNNIYLGNTGPGTATATENRTIRIGSGQQNRTFIAAIRGMNVGGNTVPVLINENGRLGTEGSSARYKQDVETMGTQSQRLLQLRPITFRYKEDTQGRQQYGLIAEEVAEIYPELVTRDDNGEVESVRYHALIPMLLNELQHQQGRLEAQAEQLSVLKADNDRLRGMIVQQQERDAALAVRLERIEAATLASR
jgi:Chaperone of endosialidase